MRIISINLGWTWSSRILIHGHGAVISATDGLCFELLFSQKLFDGYDRYHIIAIMRLSHRRVTRFLLCIEWGWSLNCRYLQVEWNLRKATTCGPCTFNTRTLKGASPSCPTTCTPADTGLYMLHYIECFFKVCQECIIQLQWLFTTQECV